MLTCLFIVAVTSLALLQHNPEPDVASELEIREDEAFYTVSAMQYIRFLSGQGDKVYINDVPFSSRLIMGLSLILGGQSFVPPYNPWIMNKLSQAQIYFARLPSAILGAATIAMVFLLSYKIGGLFAGILSTLYMLSSYRFVLYSRIAMLDVYVACFTVSSIVALYFWTKLRKRRYLAASGMLIGLAVGSKAPTNPLITAAVTVILLLNESKIFRQRIMNLGWYFLPAISSLILTNIIFMSPAIGFEYLSIIGGVAKVTFDPLNIINLFSAQGQRGYRYIASNSSYLNQLLLLFALGATVVQLVRRRCDPNVRFILLFYLPNLFFSSLFFEFGRQLMRMVPLAAIVAAGVIGIHFKKAEHFAPRRTIRLAQGLIIASLIVTNVYPVLSNLPLMSSTGLAAFMDFNRTMYAQLIGTLILALTSILGILITFNLKQHLRLANRKTN